MKSEFYDTSLHPFPLPRPLLDHEDVPFFGSVPDVLRAIRSIFGLEIVFVRAGGTLPDVMARCFTIKVDGGKSPGHLVLLPLQAPNHCWMTFAQQNEFLDSLTQLLGDAYRWQQHAQKCEEELAVSPLRPAFAGTKQSVAQQLVTQRPVTQRHCTTLFTGMLSDILKEAAQILRFQAVSLYLLETDNRMLKLRSCWGLPEERLLDPPRSLNDSLGDMEAILGQAVVLNNPFLQESWNAPEDFTTAICVPVSSSTAILGTLWFFSDDERNLSHQDSRVLEMVAGRLAAELERAALLRELDKVMNASEQ